jgi:hypothetical protein
MTSTKDLTVSDFIKKSFIQINKRPHKGKQKTSGQININKLFLRADIRNLYLEVLEKERDRKRNNKQKK